MIRDTAQARAHKKMLKLARKPKQFKVFAILTFNEESDAVEASNQISSMKFNGLVAALTKVEQSG